MVTSKCPKCGSADSVWRGYRRNRSVDKHMKLCKKCGCKYTPDDGYLRMRFKPGVIRKAMDLRKKGYSSAEVKENLRRYEGVKVSRWTIIKWERKYKKNK
jgi:transposase-like protein